MRCELCFYFVLRTCDCLCMWCFLAWWCCPEQVRERVGPTSHVIGAVSGGVDSSVAAVLMTRAIGHRFHAVMVDTGCLRKHEAEKVS